MKFPLKFSKEEDLLAIKWLIKGVIVYYVVEHWIWNWSWVQAGVQDYTPVLAWGIDRVLTLLGFEVLREQSTLFLKNGLLVYKITPWCTAVWGGFLVFLTVVVTLPGPTLLARLRWILYGALIIQGANLLRITTVMIMTAGNPEIFWQFHQLSMSVDMFIGGVLALLAVRSLTLTPRNIRVFRRSSAADKDQKDPTSSKDE